MVSFSSKVDIWSSGIILYEMLVGEKPFHWEASRRQFLAEITEGLQISHYFALRVVGCSEEVQRLLSKVLTRVEDRLRLEDIRSHGWLSQATNSASGVTGQELDQSQELEVAKEVKMSPNYFSSLTLSTPRY